MRGIGKEKRNFLILNLYLFLCLLFILGDKNENN